MEFVNLNNKNVDIQMDGATYKRCTIQTHFVHIGESYMDIISKYVVPVYEQGQYLSISEKIIALCQDRVVYKDELHVGFWAKFLSGFASTNNHGVGVSNQLKMAYCIEKNGVPKTVFAAAMAGIGKVFGKRGIFYEITGQDVSGLDGFYDHVFKEYGNYGIENPVHPEKVCAQIEQTFGIPCMIVDANDLGQEILGCSPKMQKTFTKDQMIGLIHDNPAGQDDKCTPLVLISKAA